MTWSKFVMQIPEKLFYSSSPAWLACWLAGQGRVGWPGLCLSNTIHTLLGRRGWEKMNLLSWLGEWQEYKKRWNTQKHDILPQGHRLIPRGMMGWSGKLSCFCVMLRTGVMLRLWKKQRMSCFYPKGKSVHIYPQCSRPCFHWCESISFS